MSFNLPTKRLVVFACLPYPSGSTKTTQFSDQDLSLRELVFAAKNCRAVNYRVHEFAGRHGPAVLAECFAPMLPAWARGRIIVPMPTSEALASLSGTGPGAIAMEFAKSTDMPYVELLHRTEPVQKSSGGPAQERVTVARHMETIGLDPALLDGYRGSPILLVDDAITRGTSSVACAELLRAHGFNDVAMVAGAYTLRSGDPG
jgi:hypothetical protein